MRLMSIVSALVFVLALAPREAAAGNHWSVIGSGCVLDSSSGSRATVDSAYGTVAFASGQTGFITMTCPVTAWFLDENESTDPDTIYATFDDDDGTTTTCRVWVELLRDNVGATSSRVSIGGIDDTGGGIYTQYANSSNRQQAVDVFSHAWDSASYHYWVVVQMYRSATTCNTTFYGTGLYDAP